MVDSMSLPTRVRCAPAGAQLFAAAMAVLALHAAVDAFIAPEPGTGPGDHVLRAASTLVVLALAVAAYRRGRPGVRAAVAATLGALALVGAGLAIADARAVGARGEDWTGFLLAPVGVGLLALAAVLLWRSRKPGRLRWVRRAGIAVASLLGLLWFVAPVGMAIVATHRPRAAVAPVDLGRPYRQVAVRTSDGLRLAGWYVPSRNGAAVISYPTRKGKVPQARMLVRHGYGVLLLDARGYDGSQGDPNMFGWEGTKDIGAGVAWLQRRPDVRDGRIGGIGFSVGGEAMLGAAASHSGLRAVVSEGAGVRSVREDVLRGPRGWFALPGAAVQTMALTLMSGSAPPPALQDLVPRIAPRPALLIYAGHGTGGEDLNPEYAAGAGAAATLWRIPDATHTGGMTAQPRRYEQRVVGFFDRALLGDGRDTGVR
jgi:dienelactone hydrolase